MGGECGRCSPPKRCAHPRLSAAALRRPAAPRRAPPQRHSAAAALRSSQRSACLRLSSLCVPVPRQQVTLPAGALGPLPRPGQPATIGPCARLVVCAAGVAAAATATHCFSCGRCCRWRRRAAWRTMGAGCRQELSGRAGHWGSEPAPCRNAVSLGKRSRLRDTMRTSCGETCSYLVHGTVTKWKRGRICSFISLSVPQ